ncbi:surfeit locus protein 6-domain-containing protein [Schizophyllum amplum]|uniref:Surfeit locus protein 6-domain-containing protein n=1 Tax=Schizophyllum amplum TaxID=97359 RepID=A0A550CL39_9AGAR|nr:surfeit locus protein 6-domain-containing protein [Auriculariopsis ampla]
MSASSSSTQLLKSLQRHNDTFESLLKLIPAKFYLVNDDPVDAVPSKYQKHTGKKAKEIKAAKRDRLDPSKNKTIVDLQKEAAGNEDDAMDVDLNAEEDGHSDSEIVPMQAGGANALREKLHARMAQLRYGRGANAIHGKDALIEERRRTMRERRRKETKERRKQEKTARTVKTQLLVESSPPPSAHASTSNSRNNTTTNVAFNTIDGAVKQGKKTVSNNPTNLLSHLQAQKSKLEALPADKRAQISEKNRWARAEARLTGEKNPGIAVAEDGGEDTEEKKLKKAVKRKEKEKVKSAKAWDERKREVTHSMAARQKKRTDNIAARNERRKNHGAKDGKSKGKGKQRAGFEGSSRSVKIGKGKGPKK